VGISFLSGSLAAQPKTNKKFPILGFHQNGKVVIPSFQDKISESMPLELFGWVMIPREVEPTPADLKSMGPFKLVYESKLSRKDLSTVSSDKWLVPQGSRSALLYRFERMPSPIEASGAPLVIFEKDLNLNPDYQKRSVAYTDSEYVEGLERFQSVERSYTVLWPILTFESEVFRLMELPNGAGHSLFLNHLKGLECQKTIPVDFYNRSKNQEAADFEMTAAVCGDLEFQ
jgi:hypothetical protein